MDALLASLTTAQRAAVEHIDGPLLILAGPGSGKTRVVTHRVAWMVHQGVPARQILALTFTNKAAGEMRGRIERLAPGEPVWVSTFHRFCARLLRQYAPLVGLEENYTIYDTSDSQRALRIALAREKIALEQHTPDALARAISWAKNNLIGPGDYPARQGSLLGAAVARAYPAYQRQLLSSNAVDFDDLLVHIASLLRENDEVRGQLDERFRYIMVDEYQDTNLAQYAIARGLSANHPNLAVTGDPDQSIYGWRGANLSNILEFERDFPAVRVVRLEQNYRSTKCILHAADELIRHNIRRKDKRLFTENGFGRPVRLVSYATEREEATDIVRQIAEAVQSARRRPRDFAVFYRVNALSRGFELALREAGVPYQLVQAVQFFEREEIKDIVAYLQVVNNPRDPIALLRIVNAPPRGIGKTTIERIGDYAAARGLAWLDAARQVAHLSAIKPRAAKAVTAFVALLDRLARLANGSVEAILGHVLAASGYRDRLAGSEDERDQERLANIEELLTVARQFDERHAAGAPLNAFLEDICLVSDTDAWESGADRVTLMTLHAAKGLEFPCVFLCAVEENLLPHERSRQDEAQLEEERRLMFVGITRAQEELQISHARYRDYRGMRRMTIPSSFLMQLPREEMELITPESRAALEEIHEAPFASRAAEPGDAHERDETDASFDFGGESVQGESQEAPAVGSIAAGVEPSAPGGDSPALPFRITTADALARRLDGNHDAPISGSGAPADANDFAQGMVVCHDEWGLGRVVALSGAGGERTATVDFGQKYGVRKLRLAESALRPLR